MIYLSPFTIFGQKNFTISGHSIPELRPKQGIEQTIWKVPRPYLLVLDKIQHQTHRPGPIPKYYNYQHLGVFCKLDVQLERQLKIPVIFRLGEAQQVARKEGKF